MLFTAPAIALQAEPDRSQRFHWYAYPVIATPVQRPGVELSVRPWVAVPPIVGGATALGGCCPGALPLPAALPLTMIASSSRTVRSDRRGRRIGSRIGLAELLLILRMGDIARGIDDHSSARNR